MNLYELVQKQTLMIDGAMGTMIQKLDLTSDNWDGLEGCSEILNETVHDQILGIHTAYLNSGAHLTKTNTFGALPWVLDEYDIGNRAYELAKKGAEIASWARDAISTLENPKFVAGSLGPGTKLPSLGHIGYDEMFAGYCEGVRGILDGGVDAILLETCQDPLQIKCALHACWDVMREQGRTVPVMVSATIELSGTMLIGTDVQTLAAILEPFEIFSLGINCGTGPDQAAKHIEALSQVCNKPLTIHANAGLPENRGGCTYYPMEPEEFAEKQSGFAKLPGVVGVGGCCGTTPEHIAALVEKVKGWQPSRSEGSQPAVLASLFQASALKQNPAPLLVGERSNATGSKAFRELLLVENYEGVLAVGQKQVRTGAHVLDVSVGFAGRDESKDTEIVMGMYAEKISIPLMVDSTHPESIEIALKKIGGRPIINSANLEDGTPRFDAICALAKKHGAALVCLTIDEEGMAKTRERKVEVAKRMYERAVETHGLKGEDLVFDLLTFTVGSGDEEYFTAAIETIEAIRDISRIFPESGTVLGLSNISFGLEKHARIVLNSVFLHHCVEAGLSAAIVNTAHLLPYNRISEEDRAACEALLFNRTGTSAPLFAFIEHFKGRSADTGAGADEAYEKLSTEEKIKHLLMDGDKERMLGILDSARQEIAPGRIVNKILIDAMKEVGELFGKGEMQLPFVLQSAEVMKAAVDVLNPYLPKTDKTTETTIVLGTVKGDVHDVGKNLVDIILTNNGYKVVNIGIKADVERFIQALQEHQADCVGMSGLLVKSTQVMQENLKEFRKRGIDIPILLGGAALNRNFIEEYCKPNYDGQVLYCKDAFDGVRAMSCVEKKEFGAFEAVATEKKTEREDSAAKSVVIDPAAIVYPDSYLPPKPPFWGRRVMELSVQQKELAFEWINHRMLFRERWGYKKKKLSDAEYESQMEKEVRPQYHALKERFLDDGLFQPVVIYGYWRCQREGDSLRLFENEALKDTVASMSFPRQSKSPHRNLADYFSDQESDVVGLSLVSSGAKLAEVEAKLYQAGNYHEYYLMHGLGVELAEALAEMVHKQMRIELGLAKEEGESLKDVKMQGYQGCRYSPGYPACPDLELNEPIFELLRPEEFGVTLTETHQIVPEQSTCAMVSFHPDAKYFNI